MDILNTDSFYNKNKSYFLLNLKFNYLYMEKLN